MAADGQIIIDTKINSQGAKSGVDELKAALKELTASVRELTSVMSGSFSGVRPKATEAAAAVDEIASSAKTAATDVKTLQEQMDAIPVIRHDTPIQDVVDEPIRTVELSGDFDELGMKARQFMENYEKGMAAAGQATNEFKQQISTLSAELKAMEKKGLYFGDDEYDNKFKELDRVKKALAAYKEELLSPAETPPIPVRFDMNSFEGQKQKLKQQLKELEKQGITLGNPKYDQLYAELQRVIQAEKEYRASLTRTDQEQKKASGSADTMRRSIKNASKAMKDSKKQAIPLTKSIFRLGNMFKLLLIRMAMRAVIKGVREGFQNLAQYSEDTNKAMSDFMSTMTRFKNAFATAFSPLVEFVMPALTRFIHLLADGLTTMSQFLSALSGKDTFVRAVKVQQDYAESLKDTSKETNKASDATKKSLGPFDDLIQLTNTAAEEDKNKNELLPEDMFETVEIESDVAAFADLIKSTISDLVDVVSTKWREMSDLFTEGFEVGVGDLSVLDSIKGNIASIANSIRDIFTDTAVVDSFNNMLNTVSYNLGRMAGSFASIGLSIADNLTGGLALYLESASGRIKEYLVSMFDITSETSTIYANYAVAVAEIFSVFRSDTAKEVTANIIAIFADAFMGITEVVAKTFRDVSDVLLTPITNNSGKIREAMLNTLEPINEILGAISDGIVNTFSKYNEMYDNYIAPAYKSIRDGLSEILSTILDGYNQHIAPVLQKLGEKFSEVFNGAIQPAINTAIDLIGKLNELFAVLWENILQPLLKWIANNILPVIAPIVKSAGEIFLGLVETAFEVLDGIIEALGGVVDFLTGVFSGDWKKAWEGIKSIFSGVSGAILALLSGQLELMGNIVSGALEIIGNVIELALNAIASLISSIWNGITDSLSNLWNTLKGNAENIFTGIANAISSVWESLRNTTTRIWNTIVDTIMGIIDKIVGGVESMVNNVISGINKIIESINGLISKIGMSIPKIPDLNISGNGNRERSGFGVDTYAEPMTAYSRLNYSTPQLATGRVVPPRAGTNSPSSIKRNSESNVAQSDDTRQILDRVAAALEQLTNQQSEAIMMVDGNRFGKLVAKFGNQENQRIGVRMVTEG